MNRDIGVGSFSIGLVILGSAFTVLLNCCHLVYIYGKCLISVSGTSVYPAR